MLYLNVGHTGLHNPALPVWLNANGVRAIYLIHDLIPVSHPEFCRAGEAAKHAIRLENALTSATGIIGNSQVTLDELAAFATERGLTVPPNRAIWISGAPRPTHVFARRLERPHFVTVGTIEGRKNHLLLLTIWRRLVSEMGERAPVLLVIGQRGWEAEAAEAMLESAAELKGCVRELAECADEDLAGWLWNARALLMPSFVEGFGLPVIEALQLGTPVIATDLPVYREVVGDIPTYLAADDAEGWEQAVREFANDGPERQRQKQAMNKYRPPDWPSHFARVEQWLQEI